MKNVLLFALLFFPFLSEATKDWFQADIGGSNAEYGNHVRATRDGGYIIAGFTLFQSSADMMLTKTDSLGRVEWAKAYGGSSGEFGSCVSQTIDGGYIMTGWGKSFGAGDDDIYLVKTDSLGVLEWGRAFGGNGPGGTSVERGLWVIQTQDSGFAVAGFSNVFGSGLNDIMVIKTDANGDTTWVKSYGTASNEAGASIDQTPDGGFLVSGNTSQGAGFLNVPLLRLDPNGDTLWTRVFGGAGGFTAANEIKSLANGGSILCGYTTAFGAGDDDALAIRVDSLGSILWSRSFGGQFDEAFMGVAETGSGRFIFAGLTNTFGSSGAGDDNMYLVATMATGDTMWTRCVGSPQGDDFALGADAGLDGGIVAVGETDGFTPGVFGQVYLVKTNGNSTCSGLVTPTQVGNPSLSVDQINWTVQNVSPQVTVATFQESVLSYSDSLLCIDTPSVCLPPVISSLSLTADSICAGDTVSININGVLNDATSWTLYQDSCGGQSLTSGPAPAFTGAPDSSAWFFVRGEGGCVSPGACDSIFVHVTNLNDSIFANSQGDTLFAIETNASYQWIDCFDSSVVVGETNQVFALPFVSTWAVELTRNGCKVISNCIVAGPLGIAGKSLQKIKLHPNPTSGIINLEIESLSFVGSSQVTVFDLYGKEIENMILTQSNSQIDISGLPKGVYILRVSSGSEYITRRIILEE